jgi:hypothetical protein
VLPLLNTIDPLTPTETAFADRTVIPPEEDNDPAPLTISTAPPTLELDAVEPANMNTSPPAPLLVDPTEMEIEPARP